MTDVDNQANKTNELLARRHGLIPGAAHTYSKGDDQFPANAPPAIERAKGAYAWGSDGRRYLDLCGGLRTCVLGHADERVNRAAIEQMMLGTNFGRPGTVEFRLADRLIQLMDVEMVKFAKNGSTVTTAATKLARAFTGRDLIASCADHPFFSYDDWFIGTTPCNAGIPEAVRALTKTFRYGDVASLRGLLEAHPGKFACVIMEPATLAHPPEGYFAEVQRLCHEHGALLILDEMITAFRLDLRGLKHRYGVRPDLVTYGKAIANGHSLAVLAGRAEVMELGGITHDEPRVFLTSTTHGAETTGLAAGLETLRILEAEGVAERLWRIGREIRSGCEAAIAANGLAGYVSVVGFEPNLATAFAGPDGKSSRRFRTLFLQEMVRANVLFQGYFAISAVFATAEIDDVVRAFAGACAVYRHALDQGSTEGLLEGPPCAPVFRPYNQMEGD